MEFSKALMFVQAKYETSRESDHCYLIYTGLTYDGCTGFCVNLYRDENGEAIITDLGATKDFYDEVTEQDWKKRCKRAGFEFNHWHIELKYEKIGDVAKFIKFIDSIADEFFDTGDE